MSAFFHRFIEKKKYLFISMIIVLSMGVIFGFYEYQQVSNQIQNFFNKLFYLNVEGYSNDYQMYIIQNGVFILICTYLSTSYIGYFGLLLMSFLKGIQLSFSLFYVFSTVPLSIIIVLFVVLQLIIELAFILSIVYMNMYISIYTKIVTFFVEQNFNFKSIMNYQLNSLIISLVLFCGALALRMYIIPMF